MIQQRTFLATNISD